MKIRSWAVTALTAGGLVGLPVLAMAAPSQPRVSGTSDAAVAEVTTVRLGGTDRFGTSVVVSRNTFPSGAAAVFVASGLDFPDALAGGPAAARKGGPVLLSNPGSVPATVVSEIKRLKPGKIYVLGGPSVLSSTVLNQLQGLASGGASRLSGVDRQDTAAAIGGLWSTSRTVYIASGADFPDALAGGAAAAHDGAPLLLATKTSLSAKTVSRLKALKPTKVVLLGGTSVVPTTVNTRVKAAVPNATVVRYAGTDRYSTSAMIAAKVWTSGATKAFYAVGTNFPDAASGVPAAAVNGAPMLLTTATCAPASVRSQAAALGLVTEYLLGSTGVIADGATTCTAQTAMIALNALPVKGRAAKTGYDRDQFGSAWTDDVTVQGGHNGCDTRNDVLRRDLTAIKLDPNTGGCVVLSGTLLDPFSGKTINFVRGVSTSSAVQIDHLVPLSNAWQTGAQQLTAAKRKDFANDPLNLWAVDGPLNSSKGDGDAATWLPPSKGVRCQYVAHQVAVKKSYNLWVTSPEKDAIKNILNGCPTQLLPTIKDWSTPPRG